MERDKISTQKEIITNKNDKHVYKKIDKKGNEGIKKHTLQVPPTTLL